MPANRRLAAPQQAHDIGKKRQDRQRDDEGQHARHHQDFERIDRQRSQCIDFLMHHHRADLRGEGTAGAAGNHNCRQQDPDLPQHRHGDKIDDEDFDEAVTAYRAYLETHRAEWPVLDTLCRITISRFYRDRGVFDRLRETLLPALARRAGERGRTTLRAWSAGCASGEEAYTLALLWQHGLQLSFPHASLHITATDAGAHMLERARHGCYPNASLKELPPAWIDAAFARSDDEYCIHPAYRDGIEWREQDLRRAMPDGPFDLILCRYLVFTYFDEPLQHACLARIAERLRPRGLLVLGKHEVLPDDADGFTALDEHNRIYQRVDV